MTHFLLQSTTSFFYFFSFLNGIISLNKELFYLFYYRKQLIKLYQATDFFKQLTYYETSMSKINQNNN